MKIDCNPYKNSLDKLLHMMIDKQDPSRQVGFVSAASHIPAIVVCSYMLAFIYPDHADLKDSYEALKKFYRYTEVKPFERNTK